MKKSIILVLCLLFGFISNSQENLYILGFKDSTQKYVSIEFELVNNLIIIPLFINDSDTLFFILDTGIIPTLLTNRSLDYPFKMARTTKITGLGQEDDLEVVQSYGNKITIDNDAILTLQNIFIVNDSIDRFQLSRKMGTQIDGIIGGAIFENYVVKIDYEKRIVTLYNPKKFNSKKYKRWLAIPIDLYNGKPYLKMKINIKPNTPIIANLLFDLGTSDALWLIPGSNDSIIAKKSDNLYYLGQGVNGEIYGTYDKVDNLFFNKKIYLKNVQVSLPDTSSMNVDKGYDIVGRNGTLGSEIIKRFNVIIDYKDKRIFFEKNSYFKTKSYSDLSGLEINAPYDNINLFEVFFVQKKSPADQAGIEIGDVLVKINNNSIFEYDFNELNLLFRSKVGRKIKIEYSRDGKNYVTFLILRDYRTE